MIFMKNIQHQIRGVLAAGIFVGALNCGAQQTNNTDSVPAFSTFNIITRNNIFDPNRTGRIVTDHTPRVRRTVDVLKLVGTMSYEKGKFAFFDGSSADYKKVLEPSANIIGYTVKDITGTSVTL